MFTYFFGGHTICPGKISQNFGGCFTVIDFVCGVAPGLQESVYTVVVAGVTVSERCSDPPPLGGGTKILP